MKVRHMPKSFGVEYARLKSTDQYPMFAAVALGIKLCYDDWIDLGHYQEFLDICAKYRLHCEPDIVFRTSASSKQGVVGGSNITTTFAEGVRLKDANQGSVHVIVSKDKEAAKQAKRFGWYNVVIKNRSINKPFVDHLRFGRLLGFPECCVDFFRLYNNWSVYSHPFETYKNTPSRQGSYLCNNFLMDNCSFLIHHLPCSYTCPATIKYAKRLERALRRHEPQWVAHTASMLKKPLLVFGERHFILFEGKLTGRRISYTDFEYFRNPARPEEDIGFINEIKGGASVELSEKLIITAKNGGKKAFKKEKTWFLMGFK